MLKETETEEKIVFFVTFLSLVAFQLGAWPGPPSGYAYEVLRLVSTRLSFHTIEASIPYNRFRFSFKL